MLRDLIREKVPKEEMLAGLAEEATELAQAALKYRRTLTRINPTPISEEEAHEHLLEEIADVNLYLNMLNLRDENLTAMRCMQDKERRWAERLGVNTDA